MGYRLGVDLGTTFTTAVVHRPNTGNAPTVVPLGDRSAAIPSVLFLGEDGTVLIGEAAERRALTDPDRVVRRFKRRIGDETPLLVGPAGEGLTAHALAARMIALVSDRVAEREGGAPDEVAVTVPATWGTHKKELLTGALTREGLVDVTLVSEPAAAALAYADTGRLGSGATVAVYDFGGGTFDATLLRAEPGRSFTPLGTPSGLPDLGGIDFDDAVLAYVLGTAGPQTPGLDAGDALHMTAMARLRRECVDAKEALSADTAVTVPVLLGAAQTSVRLTRSDFEAMIAGAVEETCTAVEATLVSAGLTCKNLDRILLTGGSSRIPLVTQLLSARYPGVTLERDIDPKLAVAVGGVLALEQAKPAGGRHAAPRPTGLAAAKPARPALAVESFDDRPEETAPAQSGPDAPRRKAPALLMAAAGVVLLGGLGLTQFGALNLGDALPAGTFQEAHASTEDATTGLEIEAIEDTEAKGKPEKNKEGAAPSAASTTPGTASVAATSADSDNSAGTASGRTEGSAPTRSAESSGSDDSDATSRDVAPAKIERTAVLRDQATVERKAARADGAAPAASGSTQAAPATQPDTVKAAPQEPGTAEAAPAETAAEDTSMDTGSVELNDGGPGEDAP